jgi:hypothetical protein
MAELTYEQLRHKTLGRTGYCVSLKLDEYAEGVR